MLFVCWALKQYLIYLLEQEAAFRKVVQATMVRDRQHGPVVELNRIQVHQEIHANNTTHSLNICTLIICFTITSFQVPPPPPPPPHSFSHWEGVFQTGS